MDRAMSEKMVLVTMRCKHGCLGRQYRCRPFPEALTGFLRVACSKIPGHLVEPPRGEPFAQDYVGIPLR
jgi:hypothetical protein